MSTTEKKKYSNKFQRLIDNNKFVFLISLLIAFAIWVTVAMYASPEEEINITVPITIDLDNAVISRNNYRIFGTYDDTVELTVRGPRYLMSSLKADDFSVIAKTNNVDSAGISSLPLKATVVNNSDDLEISELSFSDVTVYFDAMESRTFDVQVDDSEIKDSVADGFVLKDVAPLSTTVQLSGPKTEIDKVQRVVIIPSVDAALASSQTIDTKVSLEGTSAKDTVTVNEYVEFDDTVKVKLSVWEKKTLKTEVELLGNSTKCSFTVTPAEINVLVDTELSEEMKSLVIASVDCDTVTEKLTKAVSVEDVDFGSSVELADEIAKFSYTVTKSE